MSGADETIRFEEGNPAVTTKSTETVTKSISGNKPESETDEQRALATSRSSPSTNSEASAIPESAETLKIGADAILPSDVVKESVPGFEPVSGVESCDVPGAVPIPDTINSNASSVETVRISLPNTESVVESERCVSDAGEDAVERCSETTNVPEIECAASSIDPENKCATESIDPETKCATESIDPETKCVVDSTDGETKCATESIDPETKCAADIIDAEKKCATEISNPVIKNSTGNVVEDATGNVIKEATGKVVEATGNVVEEATRNIVSEKVSSENDDSDSMGELVMDIPEDGSNSDSMGSSLPDIIPKIDQANALETLPSTLDHSESIPTTDLNEDETEDKVQITKSGFLEIEETDPESAQISEEIDISESEPHSSALAFLDPEQSAAGTEESSKPSEISEAVHTSEKESEHAFKPSEEGMEIPKIEKSATNLEGCSQASEVSTVPTLTPEAKLDATEESIHSFKSTQEPVSTSDDRNFSATSLETEEAIEKPDSTPIEERSQTSDSLEETTETSGPATTYELKTSDPEDSNATAKESSVDSEPSKEVEEVTEISSASSKQEETEKDNIILNEEETPAETEVSTSGISKINQEAKDDMIVVEESEKTPVKKLAKRSLEDFQSDEPRTSDSRSSKSIKSAKNGGSESGQMPKQEDEVMKDIPKEAEKTPVKITKRRREAVKSDESETNVAVSTPVKKQSGKLDNMSDEPETKLAKTAPGKKPSKGKLDDMKSDETKTKVAEKSPTKKQPQEKLDEKMSDEPETKISGNTPVKKQTKGKMDDIKSDETKTKVTVNTPVKKPSKGKLDDMPDRTKVTTRTPLKKQPKGKLEDIKSDETKTKVTTRTPLKKQPKGKLDDIKSDETKTKVAERTPIKKGRLEDLKSDEPKTPSSPTRRSSRIQALQRTHSESPSPKKTPKAVRSMTLERLSSDGEAGVRTRSRRVGSTSSNSEMEGSGDEVKTKRASRKDAKK